jgi:hypothetical protein
MLKKAFRVAIPVVAAGVGMIGAVSPNAIAGSSKKVPPTSVIRDPVLRDCVNHGEITRKFSLRNLRAAQRHIPQDVATYTSCPSAVESAIAALSGPAGKNTTGAIVADCVRHKGGALTRRYELAALRRARHSLPPDVAKYTPCAHTIASQINTLT